ncbi:uncharacterized protein LOC122401244 isoform X2 [Colletes gigas]|uniref:uncharacterized protein LOC122401244 isoform X2 n=1 Tax=Colletes gigas TaxID=935657 RepID=UPI001C9AE2E8|nr:uncharacterized protein LOC122401244 isoform X2 [Colletes gigas]
MALAGNVVRITLTLIVASTGLADNSWPSCAGKTILRHVGLSCEEKQAILDEHNRLRQLVALGQIHGQPAAANMKEMIDSQWGKIWLERGRRGPRDPTTTFQIGDSESRIGSKKSSTIIPVTATKLATILNSSGVTRSFWAVDTPSTTILLEATPRITFATTGQAVTCSVPNPINLASLLAVATGCLIRIDMPAFVLEAVTIIWEPSASTVNQNLTTNSIRGPEEAKKIFFF